MVINTISYNYKHVPTIAAFTLSNKRIKCIMGAIGSGKSSGCVMALLRYATQQAPLNGIRQTRYAVVRNTTKQLKDTTKKTIDEWITPLKPKWRESDDTYFLEFALSDKTIVKSEWILRGLDRPDQVADLLSLELSGAWINEAREVPKEVFDMLDTRIGRFPRKQGAHECSYPFIIMDTNPPDDDNWIYKLFEEKVPNDPVLSAKAEIFKQPSALSAEAENLPNLKPDYYQELMIGKDEDFIRVYIHGEYGYVKEGKPVFVNFVPNLHIANEPLIPIKNSPLTIGIDFGLFPSCVILQILSDGRCYVYDEIVSEESSDIEEMVKFSLIPLLKQKKYMDIPYIIIGDPAGMSRSQLDSRTCFQVLRAYGLKAYPAATNSLQRRLSAVNQYLTRMIKGKPSFLVDKSCTTLIKGLSGKYCFKRLRVSEERYTNVPHKNFYSHVCDALTYACVGNTLRVINKSDEFFTPSRTERTRIII